MGHLFGELREITLKAAPFLPSTGPAGELDATQGVAMLQRFRSTDDGAQAQPGTSPGASPVRKRLTAGTVPTIGRSTKQIEAAGSNSPDGHQLTRRAPMQLHSPRARKVSDRELLVSQRDQLSSRESKMSDPPARSDRPRSHERRKGKKSLLAHHEGRAEEL